MSDPITIPGVRVGQVWQPTGVSQGERRGLLLVVQLEMHDVVMAGVRPDGTRTGRRTSSQRWHFEQRYRLVSEGGEPDA